MLIKLSVPRDFTVTVSFVFTFTCADSTLHPENDSKKNYDSHHSPLQYPSL